MYVTSILRRHDTSYCKPYFQLVKTSHTGNDLTQNFPCQVSASGKILWCSMVCLLFFFFLLMSARAAQLFLWAAGQRKPCKITLGAFLKGPSVSLSWGKALNLCQRCDFLLETCFSWKTCWELGEPCWNMVLNTAHPLSVPSAPNQTHPAVCLTPSSQQLLPAPVRTTAGN